MSQTDPRAAAKQVLGSIDKTFGDYDKEVAKIEKALVDAERLADEEAKRLRDCLVEVNRVLQDPETCGITDTIWYNDLITLVEFVDGVLEENPGQQQLPITQAQADNEESDE